MKLEKPSSRWPARRCRPAASSSWNWRSEVRFPPKGSRRGPRAAQDRDSVHGGSAGNGPEGPRARSDRSNRPGRKHTAACAAKCSCSPRPTRNCGEETGSLVNSLKQPQVKGKWGELTLRRVVELAGMSPHCDFLEQQSVDTEEGRLRPDLIVHLPGDTQIVVDAKVPLHAFFKAVSARSDAEYREAMIQHASLVRDHIKRLVREGILEAV